MSLRLVVGPTVEPVTLDEAKSHLRVDDASEDALIGLYIQAAREHVEHFTRRSLLPTQWEWRLDGFRDVIELPRPPLLSVEAVAYTDSLGVEQLVAASSYVVDTASEPGRLYLAHGARWPVARWGRSSVQVRFTAGYDAPAQVPASIKQAILFLVGNWFINRESVITGTIVTQIPQTVDALLWPHRFLRF